MSLDDLEEVWAIERLSFGSPWSLSQFHSELQSPISHAYTVKISHPSRKSVLAGYIIFWIVAYEAHFLNLAIHPLYRRFGIGNRLLKYALELCKKHSVKDAFLEVRSSNIPAQRLYERFGFRIIGLRKGYYSDNREDALVMFLSM